MENNENGFYEKQKRLIKDGKYNEAVEATKSLLIFNNSKAKRGTQTLLKLTLKISSNLNTIEEKKLYGDIEQRDYHEELKRIGNRINEVLERIGKLKNLDFPKNVNRNIVGKGVDVGFQIIKNWQDEKEQLIKGENDRKKEELLGQLEPKMIEAEQEAERLQKEIGKDEEELASLKKRIESNKEMLLKKEGKVKQIGGMIQNEMAVLDEMLEKMTASVIKETTELLNIALKVRNKTASSLFILHHDSLHRASKINGQLNKRFQKVLDGMKEALEEFDKTLLKDDINLLEKSLLESEEDIRQRHQVMTDTLAKHVQQSNSDNQDG